MNFSLRRRMFALKERYWTHFHVSDRWYVTLESCKHRDEGEHARHEQSNATRNRVESKPKAEPREHYDEGGRCKCLNQMMTDLSLEPKEYDQTREVTCRKKKLALREVENRTINSALINGVYNTFLSHHPFQACNHSFLPRATVCQRCTARVLARDLPLLHHRPSADVTFDCCKKLKRKI